MKAVLGQYFYTPRGNSFAVYVWDMVSETGGSANKVCSFFTKKEASDFVYEKNGWTKKY